MIFCTQPLIFSKLTRMDFGDWFEAIFDARCEVEISLSGTQGRLRLTDNWEIAGVVLPSHLFYFVADGVFSFGSENGWHRASAGDLLWFGAGTPIWTRLENGESAQIWRFRLKMQNADGEALGLGDGVGHFQSVFGAREWIERIVDEGAFPGARSDARLRALFACLLGELERSRTEKNALQSGVLTRVQRETLGRFLSANAHRWPSPRELAEAVALSPDYFTRCFRATFGMPPRRFLVEERLRLAALRLLESNQNVSQIARELGYNDVFLFSRQFKAFWKQSPLAYRQSHSAPSLSDSAR